MIKAYGLDAFDVLGDAKTKPDMGQNFGSNLTEREVVWLIENEFVHTAEDVVWRRSKLGLRMTVQEIELLDKWLAARLLTDRSDTQPGLRKGRN